MKSVVSLLLGMLLFAPAAGAQVYPTKAVNLVIPFSPGGGNDTVGRFLAEELSKRWGKPVVVENRPGGGTAVGTAYVARSKPDGYTMLLVSTSYSTNAASKPDLPFDAEKDLVAAATVGEGDLVVLASPQLKVKTLEELKAAAGSRELFYGITGVGSNMHFYGATVAEALGIKPVPVSYPGGSEALIDLVAGRLDFVVGAFVATERQNDKGVVTVAQLGEKRAPSIPDVPTIAEAGYPEAAGENYWTIFVPAGTPAETITKINEGVQEVMHSPEGEAFLARLDARPSERTVEQTQALVTDSIARWKDLAVRIGINESK